MASTGHERWIETVLVQRIKDNNSDFQEKTIEKCSVEALETLKNNWASLMYEVTLSFRAKETVSLIVKLEPEDENFRERYKTESQFGNEVHFYSVALPKLLSRVPNSTLKFALENLVPKCYYSYLTKGRKHEFPSDGVIVVENLKCKGYRLGNRSFLNLEHCTLALERLGMYHALSYFLKENDCDAFKKIVEPIIITAYPNRDKTETNSVFRVYQQRIIDALANDQSENGPVLARLHAIAQREAVDVFVDLVTVREPLAVLCHGDFLRNNVLFQYEADNVVDMKLIDFQTIRCASPAIDLSLFLCMNTSHELRSEHFLSLLRKYHNSVRRTLAALMEVSEEQLPVYYSFDGFMQDFRQHALYGYFIAIEFLPWMLAEPEELAEVVEICFRAKGSPEYNESARKLGGSRATQVMVDLAKDLVTFQCI